MKSDFIFDIFIVVAIAILVFMVVELSTDDHFYGNYRSVTQAEISLGVVICEKAGGLRRIEVAKDGNHRYTCYNGTYFNARENSN